MKLHRLHIINFKNHPDTEINFSSDVVCFAGNNGSGKTNLLDAIHYLSFCKSYFNPTDSQNILHNEPFMMIQGNFSSNNIEDTVHCGVKRNQRKQFKKNQNEYEKLADHIGSFPAVIVTPTDSALITEGSEDRRKFIDSIISQLDKAYLDTLMGYNKVLSHRNALLKSLSGNYGSDNAALEIWDEQLIQLGEVVFEKRKSFISTFQPLFSEYYRFISNGSEEVDIIYDSQFSEDMNFKILLQQSLRKDLAFQYTTVGIHKDDLEFKLNGYAVKKYGSQGQQKSFLLALKLAQFDSIKNRKGLKPLLLLDDIFDKLDNTRIEKLMELVSRENFGQLFITDTDKHRIAHIFGKLNVPVQFFQVEQGTVKELTGQ